MANGNQGGSCVHQFQTRGLVAPWGSGVTQRGPIGVCAVAGHEDVCGDSGGLGCVDEFAVLFYQSVHGDGDCVVYGCPYRWKRALGPQLMQIYLPWFVGCGVVTLTLCLFYKQSHIHHKVYNTICWRIIICVIICKFSYGNTSYHNQSS